MKRSPVAIVCLRRHEEGALSTCARVTSMYQPKTRVQRSFRLGDPRRLAQPPLELHDEALSATHPLARFVERRVETVAHDTAVARARRGIVGDAARKKIMEVCANIDPRLVLGHAERLARVGLGAARQRVGELR